MKHIPAVPIKKHENFIRFWFDRTNRRQLAGLLVRPARRVNDYQLIISIADGDKPAVVQSWLLQLHLVDETTKREDVANIHRPPWLIALLRQVVIFLSWWRLLQILPIVTDWALRPLVIATIAAVSKFLILEMVGPS